MNITQSLPRSPSTRCMAISEPSASPSGFSWVTAISFDAPRISSSTASRSVSSVSGIAVQQLGDPHPVIDGAVVVEAEGRRALEAQLTCQPALEDAVGGGEPLERRGPGRL